MKKLLIIMGVLVLAGCTQRVSRGGGLGADPVYSGTVEVVGCDGVNPCVTDMRDSTWVLHAVTSSVYTVQAPGACQFTFDIVPGAGMRMRPTSCPSSAGDVRFTSGSGSFSDTTLEVRQVGELPGVSLSSHILAYR